MNLRNILLAGTGIAVVFAAAVPAHADNIVTNQWYGAIFATALNSPLNGGQIVPGTNGPLLVGTGSSVSAPASPWTITLANGGFLTITDVETSGDGFTLSDNASTLGTTSTPTPGDNTCNDDIGCALGDANYSSGTFVLPAGINSISGLLSTSSGAGTGDTYFIVQANTGTPIPEPVSLAVLGAGMAGLAAVRRRRQ